MWTCVKCGEECDNNFDTCWNCSTPKGGATPAAVAPMKVEKPCSRWRMEHQIFRGTWSSWDELFQQAADFATELGPDRVLTISHSEDRSEGVVTVWYWTEK